MIGLGIGTGIAELNLSATLSYGGPIAIWRAVPIVIIVTVKLKACPQFVAENSDCRRKVRLSPNSATVAVVSPFSATIAVFCDSRTFLRQSPFSVTVWTGLNRSDLYSCNRGIYNAPPTIKPILLYRLNGCKMSSYS